MRQEYQSIRRGFIKALPVLTGVIPFGIAYGAAAAQALPWWGGVGMSALVFAGTAQFLAVGLISQGASALSIVLTTALVNLRYVLLGAALSPVLRKAGRRAQPLLAIFVVDESFAISSAEFERGRGDAYFFLGTGLALYVIWQVSTVLGITFGPLIPGGFGLEFAFQASFIGLLALLVRTRPEAMVALLAAVLSLVLHTAIPATWSPLVATILAATIGVLWERSRSGA
jgi:4-azaleucine resistance transporter AzlC